MRTPRTALLSVVTALALGTSALADEIRVTNDGHVIAFEGNPTRLRVRHDRSAGKLVFRLAEPTLVLREAPVVLLRTPTGTQEVTLVPLAGEPGTWVMIHEALRAERYDGSVRILVDGKTFTAPLPATTAVPIPAARHQGRVIAFDECGVYAELVQDPASGTLTLHSFDGMRIEQAPSIAVKVGEQPTEVAFVAVDGQAGAWRSVHAAFKARHVAGRLRVVAGGKTCTAVLRGGELVTVPNGPRFEVVYDREGQTATFYALDPEHEGRAYVIEQPTFVYPTEGGPRTVVLVPVSGEPRTWRAVGVDARLMRPGDALLRFTLAGRSLEGRIGLSGLGIDLR